MTCEPGEDEIPPLLHICWFPLPATQMRRIAIRFPLAEANGEKPELRRGNSSLMKRRRRVCDQHERRFWLSFMAGCHPKSVSKSSFLIQRHPKKQHFLFPHARLLVLAGRAARAEHLPNRSGNSASRSNRQQCRAPACTWWGPKAAFSPGTGGTQTPNVFLRQPAARWACSLTYPAASGCSRRTRESVQECGGVATHQLEVNSPCGMLLGGLVPPQRCFL